MSTDSAMLDVFGTWWGALEFIILFAIVAAVSYFGVMVLQTNFTKHSVTGNIQTPLGGDNRKLFKTAMSTVDPSASEGNKAQEQEQYANQHVSETIRQHTEIEMKKAGLDSNRYPSLASRIQKRVAALIGLKPRDTYEKLKSLFHQNEPQTPFKDIDIRIDTSPASLSSSPSSSIVKVSVLDGVLPESIPLPFFMCVSVTEVDSGSRKITFRDVKVTSLANGILLDAKDKQKTASIFQPRNKLNVTMEAYTGKEGGPKVLLYDGEASVSSPLPSVTEILSCKNFALMRIDEPTSPYYESTYYSEGTLNELYVTEYPHNMPELTPDAVDASNAAPRLIDHTTDSTSTSNENEVGIVGCKALREPTVAFIYGKAEALPQLTHDLYNMEIKQADDNQKYIIMPAQDISVLRNPARPTERYMSMSVAENSVPGSVKLMGWVVGFERGDVLSGTGGFNVVFPADRGDYGYADLSFSEAVKASSAGVGSVVLHNTASYIGCFGNREKVSEDGGSHSWDGPVVGEQFFSYHIRPCVVIRWNECSPPKIGAIMSSPVTEYAGKRTTGLLPRALSVSAGPLPVDDPLSSLVNTAVLGGDFLTFAENQAPERLCAIFPKLRTTTGLVNRTDSPYTPLHSMLSKDRARALPVRKIVTKGIDEGHALFRVFDKETGVTLGRAAIQLGEQQARPIFVDGARDDRPFSVDVAVFCNHGRHLPVKPTGIYIGMFLNMTTPDNEAELWNEPSRYSPMPHSISLPPSKPSVVFCRTTSPPVSNRGTREPFMQLCGLVPFPSSIPEWAFVGSVTSNFPRHIFISSIRVSDVTNKITNPDGTVFSPEQWLKGNLHAPSQQHRSPPLDPDEAAYVRGEKTYASLYLGGNAMPTAIDQAVRARNGVAWIVTETGNVMDVALSNNDSDRGRMVGRWGVIVFGANPHPEEPADRYTTWRTTGRLRLVVVDSNGKYPSVSQPVNPLQVRLATWPNGDPVIRMASGEIVVRLDPRVGGVCSANGLYNTNDSSDPSKLTTSVLFVVVDTASRKVKYIERAPLYWKLVASHHNIADNLIPVNRDCPAQRRMWNRTTFDHDRLLLCVKIPNAINHIEGTAMLVDHLVFACSASLEPMGKRTDFYQRFISHVSDVIFDGRHSGFNISVPYNFSTTCGFVVSK